MINSVAPGGRDAEPMIILPSKHPNNGLKTGRQSALS